MSLCSKSFEWVSRSSLAGRDATRALGRGTKYNNESGGNGFKGHKCQPLSRVNPIYSVYCGCTPTSLCTYAIQGVDFNRAIIWGDLDI